MFHRHAAHGSAHFTLHEFKPAHPFSLRRKQGGIDGGVANVTPAATVRPMSITVVVENDTIKLPPGVHVPDGTKAEIILAGVDEAGMPERAVGRPWSPEELGVAAEKMVAEKNPVEAQAQWKRIVAGFYGVADA